MKSIVVVVLILLFSSIMTSQTISKYGVKFGVVSSKVDLKLNPNDTYIGSFDLFKERREGISFGFFLHMLDQKYFDIESELLYQEEGSEDNAIVSTTEQPFGTGDYLIFDHEYVFLKFNVNIRPKYVISNNSIFLSIGPSINYLLKNRGEFYFKDLSDFHFGVNYGFGIELHEFLRNTIIFEFKSNVLFGKFADTERAEAEMNSWQINVGLVL